MSNGKLFLSLFLVLCFALSLAYGQTDAFLEPYGMDENTVLLLHFDGDTVNEAEVSADAVGHGNYMFVDNDMGGFNKCAYLDNDARSDSTFFTVADTNALDLDSSWTVECWAKVLTFGSAAGDWHVYPKLVSKPDPPNTNFWMGINGMPGTENAQQDFHTKTGVNRSVVTDNGIIETNKWYHVASIYNLEDRVASIIVHDRDGNLVDYNSSYIPEESVMPATNDHPVDIGATIWPDTYLNGLIDEVRISNTVRNFNIPPEIVCNPVKKVEPDTQIPIEAKIANTGWDISNVSLHYDTYTPEGHDGFIELSMSASDGVNYSANIPGQPVGTSIRYYITVENTNGDMLDSRLVSEESDTAYFGVAIENEKSKVLELDFEQNLDDATGINKLFAHKFIGTEGKVAYSDDAISGDYSFHFQPQPSDSDTVVTMLSVEGPAPFLAFEDGYTIDMWFKPDTIESWNVLAGKFPEYYNDNNDWKFNYRFFADGRHNDKICIENYYSNTSWQRVYLDKTEQPFFTETHKDEWFHIITQFSAEKSLLLIEIYDEEGNLVDSNWENTGGHHPMIRAGAFTLGGDIYDFMAPTRFQGKMDAVKIYNYAAYLPPTLESSPFKPIAHVSPNQDTTINISIDNSVKTEIHYFTSGGDTTTEELTKSGDMDYSYTFSGHEIGSCLKYYITAVNASGKSLRVPGAGSNIIAYDKPKDMVLHLDFESGEDNPVDNSDYNNEITLINDVGYSSDALTGDQSIYLPNDSSFLEISAPAPFVINDEMTIQISFNADSLSINGADLISKFPDPPNWEFGYRVSFQDGGKLFPEFFLVSDNPSDPDHKWDNLFLANDTRIEAGNWYTFILDVSSDSAYVKLLDSQDNILDQNSKKITENQHINPVAGVFHVGHSFEPAMPNFIGKIDNVKIFNYSKESEPVSVEDDNQNEIPTSFKLAQNYPNPFNPTTNIKFNLPLQQKVELNIYNLVGQKVRTLVNSELSAGKYNFKWNGRNSYGNSLPSGVYFYQLKTDKFVKTRKMLFIK